MRLQASVEVKNLPCKDDDVAFIKLAVSNEISNEEGRTTQRQRRDARKFART